MLCIYLVFVTPDRGARVLRHDPDRDRVAGIIEALDWFGRYRVESTKGAPFTIVDRDGTELRGLRAAACVFGTIPVLFIAWPVVALAATRRRVPKS
jgi:hypothetical protein